MTAQHPGFESDCGSASSKCAIRDPRCRSGAAGALHLSSRHRKLKRSVMPRLSKTFAWAAAAALLAIAAFAVYRWRSPQAPAGTVASASPTAPASASADAPPSPDGIAFADAHAGAVRVSSAANAWGGARSGSEATLSDRVVDYHIEARLDPEAHTIEGRQQLAWRNRSDREVRTVYLHLYLNAFEGEGSTFLTEKRELGFEFRTDVPIKDGDWGHIELRKVEQQGASVPWRFVHPDGGPQTDHTVVRLDLPVPVAAGASTRLDIDFCDRLPSYRIAQFFSQ